MEIKNILSKVRVPRCLFNVLKNILKSEGENAHWQAISVYMALCFKPHYNSNLYKYDLRSRRGRLAKSLGISYQIWWKLTKLYEKYDLMKSFKLEEKDGDTGYKLTIDKHIKEYEENKRSLLDRVIK
jgi:hypothetical protein